MNKPVIGVTPLFDTEKDSIWMLPGYMEVLTACGALPVILPLDPDSVGEMAELCDGFLFTGGQDVDPALYGQKILPACGEIYPLRDLLEAELFRRAFELDKPIFGICRGIQFINVVLGGSLYQDIPGQKEGAISHRMAPPYYKGWHEVCITPGTPLRHLLGKELLNVNSYHHQGIRSLSKRLKTMAMTSDGLVEAVYCPEKRFLQAVQWHPEFSWQHDGDQFKIMRSFVDACRKG